MINKGKSRKESLKTYKERCKKYEMWFLSKKERYAHLSNTISEKITPEYFNVSDKNKYCCHQCCLFAVREALGITDEENAIIMAEVKEELQR